MRATPLSVYCYKLDTQHIFECTQKDVNLTHSNEIPVHAVAAYNIAIAHLLNNFGDAEGAYRKAGDFIKSTDCKALKAFWADLDKAESQDDLISATSDIGFVIIAFTYAFYYLRQDDDYETVMHKTLLLGKLQFQC